MIDLLVSLMAVPGGPMLAKEAVKEVKTSPELQNLTEQVVQRAKTFVDTSVDCQSRLDAILWLNVCMSSKYVRLADGNSVKAADAMVRALALSGSFEDLFALIDDVGARFQSVAAALSPEDDLMTSSSPFSGLEEHDVELFAGAATLLRLAALSPRGSVMVAQHLHESAIAAFDGVIRTLLHVERVTPPKNLAPNASTLTVQMLHLLDKALLHGPWAQVEALVRAGAVRFIVDHALTERAWQHAEDVNLSILGSSLVPPSGSAGMHADLAAAGASMVLLRALKQKMTAFDSPGADEVLRVLRDALVFPGIIRGLLFREAWRALPRDVTLCVLDHASRLARHGGYQHVVSQHQLLADAIAMVADVVSWNLGAEPAHRETARIVEGFGDDLKRVQAGSHPRQVTTFYTVNNWLQMFEFLDREWAARNDVACDACLTPVRNKYLAGWAPPSSTRAPALLCSRCRLAVYCSKECQRAAWKAHKDDCRAVPLRWPAQSVLR